MPIAFKCPSCGKVYNVKDELAGKVAGCACGAKFRIPQPRIAPPPAYEEEPVPQEPEDDAYEDSSVGEAYDDGGYEDDAYSDEEQDAADDVGDVDAEAPADDFGMDESDESAPESEAFDDEPIDSEPPQEEETGDESLDDITDGFDEESNEEDDAEALKDEDEEVLPAPKSWVGRIFILLGAACLIASLFLPWVKESAAPQAPVPAVEDADDATTDAITDTVDEENTDTVAVDEVAAEAVVAEVGDEVEDEAAPEADAPTVSSGKALTGLELATQKAAANPILYAIFGAVGAAGLLLILALIPGVILSGGGQMVFGLLLTLGVTGAAGASAFGASQFAGVEIPELIPNAELGLFLLLGGAVACFLGGLICSVGVFKAPKAGAAAGKAGRGERGGRERGGRASRATARMPKRPSADDDDGDAGSAKKSARPKPPLGKKSGAMKPPFAKKKKGAKKVSKKIVLKPKAGGKKSSRRG